MLAMQVRSAFEDPWKILSVSRNAKEDEIKKAHRKLVLRCVARCAIQYMCEFSLSSVLDFGHPHSHGQLLPLICIALGIEV